MASPPRPAAHEFICVGNLSEGGSDPPNLQNSGPTQDVVAALNYGLEMVRCGAMLVTEAGQVQLANRAALSILQKKDGIALFRSRLVAERPSETRHLHHLLQEAIWRPERGEPELSPFTVERRLNASALVVRVVPGPGLDCWNTSGHRTALLKVYDRDPDLVVDEKALISIYGLTRGEAAIAAKLVTGKSIEEVADELFISPHTGRTHLKRIFMKTDTHRQPELILRILMAL